MNKKVRVVEHQTVKFVLFQIFVVVPFYYGISTSQSAGRNSFDFFSKHLHGWSWFKIQKENLGTLEEYLNKVAGLGFQGCRKLSPKHLRKQAKPQMVPSAGSKYW